MLAVDMKADPLVTPTQTMSHRSRSTMTRHTEMLVLLTEVLRTEATRIGQVSALLKARALSKCSYISVCGSDC